MNLLIQLLCKLLADSNIMIIGPALMAFNQICPEKLDLLHGHLRRIIRTLPQIEFIFIPNTVHILTRYARFYLDKQFAEGSSKLDSDMKSLLESVEQLLNYDSPSVIISAAEFFLFFKAEAYYQKSITALLTFKYHPHQIAFLQLSLLYEYAKVAGNLFNSIFSYFYIIFTEHSELILKKLEILGIITSENNATSILKELTCYSSHENQEISALAITTIGKICENNQNLSIACTKHLVTLLKSKSPYITSQVIIVMRKLINHDPFKHKKIIVHCAKNIENIHFPVARACALWIIGKYYQFIPTLAGETIRKLALGFAKENTLVKHQLLNSTAKIYSETNNELLRKVFLFLLELGFYDISYDIRDKSRLLSSIFVNNSLKIDNSQVFASSNEILSVKQISSAFVPITLSYLTESRVNGYERYWEELTNKDFVLKTLEDDTKNLRDEEITPTLTVKQSTSYSNLDVSNVSGTGLKTRVVVNDPASLQAFLADEEEEDDEDYEEGESEEEDEN